MVAAKPLERSFSLLEEATLVKGDADKTLRLFACQESEFIQTLVFSPRNDLPPKRLKATFPGNFWPAPQRPDWYQSLDENLRSSEAAAEIERCANLVAALAASNKPEWVVVYRATQLLDRALRWSEYESWDAWGDWHQYQSALLWELHHDTWDSRGILPLLERQPTKAKPSSLINGSPPTLEAIISFLCGDPAGNPKVRVKHNDLDWFSQQYWAWPVAWPTDFKGLKPDWFNHTNNNGPFHGLEDILWFDPEKDQFTLEEIREQFRICDALDRKLKNPRFKTKYFSSSAEDDISETVSLFLAAKNENRQARDEISESVPAVNGKPNPKHGHASSDVYPDEEYRRDSVPWHYLTKLGEPVYFNGEKYKLTPHREINKFGVAKSQAEEKNQKFSYWRRSFTSRHKYLFGEYLPGTTEFDLKVAGLKKGYYPYPLSSDNVPYVPPVSLSKDLWYLNQIFWSDWYSDSVYPAETNRSLGVLRHRFINFDDQGSLTPVSEAFINVWGVGPEDEAEARPEDPPELTDAAASWDQMTDAKDVDWDDRGSDRDEDLDPERPDDDLSELRVGFIQEIEDKLEE